MPVEELTYREGVRQDIIDIRNSLARLETDMSSGFKGVHKRQDIQNGKVNKIIIALVGAVCLSVGMGLTNGSIILKLLGI